MHKRANVSIEDGSVDVCNRCTNATAGEEATNIGAATALDPSDMVFAQYREHGVLLWRGYTLTQFANQLMGNELEPGKGRQMPIHYGRYKHLCATAYVCLTLHYSLCEIDVIVWIDPVEMLCDGSLLER